METTDDMYYVTTTPRVFVYLEVVKRLRAKYTVAVATYERVMEVRQISLDLVTKETSQTKHDGFIY
jgi:hypothetical protein